MLKKYFTVILAVVALQAVAFADDAVFSNEEAEQFTLQPLNYSEKPVVEAKEAMQSPMSATSNKPIGSDLSNANYLNAINNLDNAQVELREQIANYTSLMAQTKAEYQAKKAEYNNYKKLCKEYKKKMRNVEASKKKIQENVYVNSTNK